MLMSNECYDDNVKMSMTSMNEPKSTSPKPNVNAANVSVQALGQHTTTNVKLNPYTVFLFYFLPGPNDKNESQLDLRVCRPGLSRFPTGPPEVTVPDASRSQVRNDNGWAVRLGRCRLRDW